jgi:UDP-glucuronate 4-epimerase
LGDSHRVWDFLATYSLSKIAAEAMARFCARHLSLPTTIARLNVPYGDNGGWPAVHVDMMLAGMAIPVHTDGPSTYSPSTPTTSSPPSPGCSKPLRSRLPSSTGVATMW